MKQVYVVHSSDILEWSGQIQLSLSTNCQGGELEKIIQTDN